MNCLNRAILFITVLLAIAPAAQQIVATEFCERIYRFRLSLESCRRSQNPLNSIVRLLSVSVKAFLKIVSRENPASILSNQRDTIS